MKYSGKKLEEIRVKVCKDVIAQIEVKKYVAQEGTYCDFSGCLDAGKLKPQLARKVMPQCNVCAIGATFLSLIRLKNEFNLGYSTSFISSVEMRNKLEDIWDMDDLRLLENVFEHTGSYRDLEGLYDEKRLLVMMKHLIKHKGDVSSFLKIK